MFNLLTTIFLILSSPALLSNDLPAQILPIKISSNNESLNCSASYIKLNNECYTLTNAHCFKSINPVPTIITHYQLGDDQTLHGFQDLFNGNMVFNQRSTNGLNDHLNFFNKYNNQQINYSLEKIDYLRDLALLKIDPKYNLCSDLENTEIPDKRAEGFYNINSLGFINNIPFKGTNRGILLENSSFDFNFPIYSSLTNLINSQLLLFYNTDLLPGMSGGILSGKISENGKSNIIALNSRYIPYSSKVLTISLEDIESFINDKNENLNVQINIQGQANIENASDGNQGRGSDGNQGRGSDGNQGRGNDNGQNITNSNPSNNYHVIYPWEDKQTLNKTKHLHLKLNLTPKDKNYLLELKRRALKFLEGTNGIHIDRVKYFGFEYPLGSELKYHQIDGIDDYMQAENFIDKPQYNFITKINKEIKGQIFERLTGNYILNNQKNILLFNYSNHHVLTNRFDWYPSSENESTIKVTENLNTNKILKINNTQIIILDKIYNISINGNFQKITLTNQDNPNHILECQNEYYLKLICLSTQEISARNEHGIEGILITLQNTLYDNENGILEYKFNFNQLKQVFIYQNGSKAMVKSYNLTKSQNSNLINKLEFKNE